MDNSNGSELHRLRSMDGIDNNRFNRIYRKVKPLIKKLSNNVDSRRYNVTPDVIQSYFTDKMLYVFNRYHEEYDDNHLKATIISSLTNYKNRLLRQAYSEQSEYYQSLESFEGLFDDSKELVETVEEEENKDYMINTMYNFMRENLSPDAYLLFDIQLNPPPYIRDCLKSDKSKISTIILLDFLGLARTKTNSNYIAKLRREIEENTEKAKNSLK